MTNPTATTFIPTLDQAVKDIRQAAELGILQTFEGALCDSDPFDLPTIFVGTDGSVSIDLQDDSVDGFSSHEIGTMAGLHSQLSDTQAANA